MSLTEVMQTHLAFHAGNTQAFGETVTYTTRAGVATADMPAIVFREQARDAETGVHLAGTVDVVIPYGSAGRSTVDVGGDKITVSTRQGDSARACLIREIIQQDAGGWWLRCG